MSTRKRHREDSWGRNGTKEKRKRSVKIRAREKERNIKTHILREQQAESAKMSREKEKLKQRKVRPFRQRTRRQTKTCLGILVNHWNKEKRVCTQEKEGCHREFAGFRRVHLLRVKQCNNDLQEKNLVSERIIQNEIGSQMSMYK